MYPAKDPYAAVVELLRLHHMAVFDMHERKFDLILGNPISMKALTCLNISLMIFDDDTYVS